MQERPGKPWVLVNGWKGKAATAVLPLPGGHDAQGVAGVRVGGQEGCCWKPAHGTCHALEAWGGRRLTVCRVGGWVGVDGGVGSLSPCDSWYSSILQPW